MSMRPKAVWLEPADSLEIFMDNDRRIYDTKFLPFGRSMKAFVRSNGYNKERMLRMIESDLVDYALRKFNADPINRDTIAERGPLSLTPAQRREVAVHEMNRLMEDVWYEMGEPGKTYPKDITDPSGWLR